MCVCVCVYCDVYRGAWETCGMCTGIHARCVWCVLGCMWAMHDVYWGALCCVWCVLGCTHAVCKWLEGQRTTWRNRFFPPLHGTGLRLSGSRSKLFNLLSHHLGSALEMHVYKLDLFPFCWKRVLCCTDWHPTHYVGKDSLEFRALLSLALTC